MLPCLNLQHLLEEVLCLPATLGTLHIEIQLSFQEKLTLAGEIPSTDRERDPVVPKAIAEGHLDKLHRTPLVHSLEEFPANSPVGHVGPPSGDLQLMVAAS